MAKENNLSYIIKVPLSKGQVLLDFYSGNIIYLKNDSLFINENNSEVKEKLKGIEFLSSDTEKIEALKSRWHNIFKNRNDVFIYYYLTTSEKYLVENSYKFFKNLYGNLGDSNKINIGLIIDEENQNLNILNIEGIKNFVTILRNKIENISLIFVFTSINSLRNNSNVINYIVNDESFVKNLNLKLFIETIVSNSEEFYQLGELFQHSILGNSIPVSVLFCNDSVEEVKKLIDVVWRHQFFALFKNIFLLPASNNIHKIIFSCSYGIDLNYFNKMLTLILENNSERIIKLFGSGVVESINKFLSTNMYFPPNLKKCGAYNTFLLINTKIYFCYYDYLNDSFIDLTNDNFEELFKSKINFFKNIHLLYSNNYDENILTYGGVCPYMSLKLQKENSLKLLQFFFDKYVCYERGED